LLRNLERCSTPDTQAVSLREPLQTRRQFVAGTHEVPDAIKLQAAGFMLS
jgi:hypothetical protein